MSEGRTIELQHGRVNLALHEVSAGQGLPLLLLHELGGSSAAWPEAFALWQGPVFALDFSGHGHSSWPRGGAYSPELLAADADTALAHIGRSAVVGAGVGAYVALLLAGSRTAEVAAALLLPGRGLAGGGNVPDPGAAKLSFLSDGEHFARGGADAGVAYLDHDLRPDDYVERFVREASPLLLSGDPSARPAWWKLALQAPAGRAVPADLAGALSELKIAAGS